PVSFTEAIPKVIDGKLGCAFTASGLDSPLMEGLDKNLEFVRIMNMDLFGSWSSPTGFETFKLNGKQYPNLLKGWFGSVEVLSFNTSLFYYPTIVNENPMLHGLISQSAANIGKSSK
ncbi:MAG: hypothetical protein H7836_17880, partial [Magnetococcus sp. YQC-3]